MKKILKTIALSLILCMVPFHNVKALENNTSYIEEIFGGGSYIEITIHEENTNARSSTTKKKTATYKGSSGTVYWSVTVQGTFNYDGKTSTCTSSSISTANYSSTWKLSNKKASKSGNTASASVTAKQYHSNGTTVLQTINKTVKLTCDKNGKLS
jgi:hypothetical protein